jgi:hypothetical protein
MSARHVVVDGSNIATEGRSVPSLKQLDEAVREFLAENPEDTVTVVVDASFGHRIGPEEQKAFEEAEAAGEIVSPPAGAIGRGDAFLLRIADKTGATVLSNDSFQEFHGEYDWLFAKGRLIGGKPVPDVGWIFTPRSPVRGPKSREAVKEAKRKKAGPGAKEVVPADGITSGIDAAAQRTKGKGRARKTLERAIATATEEAVAPDGPGKRRRRRKGGTPPAEPVNEPSVFLQFVTSHKPGDMVEGEVESFSSHGAFVLVDTARCYLPLQAMGEPAPRSARELLSRGERGHFVVQAFDPARRGVELAIPGFARVAGTPTEETVKAEIRRAPAREGAEPTAIEKAAPAKRAAKKGAKAPAKAPTRPKAAPAKKPASAQAAAAKKAASEKPSGEPATAGKVTAGKVAGGQARVGQARAAKAAKTAKKAPPAKKAPSAKKAPPAAEAAPPEEAAAPKKAARATKPTSVQTAPAAGKAPAPPQKAAAAPKAARAAKAAPAQKAPGPAKPEAKAAAKPAGKAPAKASGKTPAKKVTRTARPDA